MFSGIERGKGPFAVQGVGEAEIDGVEIVAVEEGLVSGHGLAPVDAGEGGGRSAGPRGRRDEPTGVRGGQLGREFGGNSAGAEDAPAKVAGGFHRHQDSTNRLRGTGLCGMIPEFPHTPKK